MSGDTPIVLNGETADGEDGGDDPLTSTALLPMLDSTEEELFSSPVKCLKPPPVKTDGMAQTEEFICGTCQSLEVEKKEVEKSLAHITSKYETELARLRKELESANKSKEATVMRYAKSENEVIKLKREMETCSKQVTGLMKEIESLNKKQKMLSGERERLGNIVDGKNCEVQGLQKEVEKLKEDLSAKDFKIKWTQNKLNSEVEAHKETQSRLETAEAELEKVKQEENQVCWSTADPDSVSIATGESEDDPGKLSEGGLNLNGTSPTLEEGDEDEEEVLMGQVIKQTVPVALKELEAVKLRNHQLTEENNTLSCKVQALEEQRLELEQRQTRLQESNSEHLLQIATLQSELAATEGLKSQLVREQEAVLKLQGECQQVRQAQAEVLADMAVCRGKEAELLEYTQQVTEKNVSLQSEFSSIQAKSFALEEENERLKRQLEQMQVDMKNFEKMMSQECKNYQEERQTVEGDVEKQRKEILDLQRQLDEARGEIVLLHKSLNSKIRELSKELQLARRNVKDGASGSDGMSQSSRASSSSSLNNIESSPPKPKQEDLPEKPAESELPVIPDQQVLIERIVKLQRTLAKKQEKMEFLQEHVKQLTETLQKKSKIIISYAMNQDIESLSSEVSELNKAEVMKHGGIMASVYASKPSDEGLTLELSLEINRKLQIVLEDTLLKNITLKDSLNTLGKEISKLTEMNHQLEDKLSRNANPG